MGVKIEDVVFISGIGCSSRFPYYMNTFGMHGIHGRAPAIASGVKLANPDLSVWVITGDGDSLAIGGNHFIHVLRRNLDLNMILFNNKIYGLTKGQFSPTSSVGQKTKSSPFGNTQPPFSAGELALGAQARFFARVGGNTPKEMTQIFIEAEQFKGTALIEVLQNCVIFNDKTWGHMSDTDNRLENVLYLEHGKPMRFGKQGEKGIRLNGLEPEVVRVADVGEENLRIHDERAAAPTLGHLLSRMGPPDFPTPLGVLRAVDKPVYSQLLSEKVHSAQAGKTADLDALLRQGETWDVT